MATSSRPAEASRAPPRAFPFSSNDDGFLFHGRTAKEPPIERELSLDEFPPETLMRKYQKHLSLSQDGFKLITERYHTSLDGMEPNYYQVNAISRILEAVAQVRGVT